MRPLQRLIPAAVLLSLSMALAGCAGGDLGNFDPTDMLDFLDTKKKLPGDRKQVFPEGVPGLQPGVPKELYKGAQPEPEQQAAPSPVKEPKAKRGAKTAARTKSRPAPAAAPDIAPDDTNVEEGSTAAAPPAPAKRIVRRRTTAPPPSAPVTPAPAQQQAQPAPSAFPAPLPSGGFSR